MLTEDQAGKFFVEKFNPVIGMEITHDQFDATVCIPLGLFTEDTHHVEKGARRTDCRGKIKMYLRKYCGLWVETLRNENRIRIEKLPSDEEVLEKSYARHLEHITKRVGKNAEAKGQDKHVQVLTAQITGLGTTVKQLGTVINDLKQENKELHSQVTLAESRVLLLENTSAEKSGLKEELQTAREKVEQLNAQIADLQSQIERLKLLNNPQLVAMLREVATSTIIREVKTDETQVDESRKMV